MNKLFLLIILSVFALAPNAQEPEQPAQTTAAQTDEKKQSANDKKMIREANISLQTTVTGNQEQPRVMYILPWQSPLSPDLEMEMLNSQEDAVFGHVERDEMQRSLEAAGEFDSAED